MTQARSNVLKALKELYPSGINPDWFYHDHPFIGSMKRQKDLQGRHYHLPIQMNKHSGVSHNATLAAQYEGNTKFEAFEVTPPITNYARLRIESLLLRQCAESPASAARFTNFFETEMEGCMKSFGDRQAIEALQDGGGALAQVGTIDIPNGRIVLKHKGLIHFFEIQQALQGSAGDGTAPAHVLVNAGGVARITGILDDEGVLLFGDPTLPLSNLTGLAADGYLFSVGDFKAAAKGAGAWCPRTAPGPTDMFYAVNRSTRPNVLAGTRYDASASRDTYETVWQNVDLRARRFGFGNAPIHVHPEDALRFTLGKEAIKIVSNAGENANYKVGYDSYVGPNGRKFVLDFDITPGEAWMVDFSTMTYVTNGDQPKLDDYDGLELIRESEAVYRVDFVVDYLFMNPKPSGMMRIQLPRRTNVVG